ncbi:DUF1491 family protein [Novosphingobium sp. M1R2S20]|uniref:DUF1491 family protein n=1 Tax=Novosphingobium rhizovicinum TaxID=3228928 RepID=A0ABV3R9I4_9SPHN
MRLPTRLEATALIRRVESEGGFATVLAKGEPDAGSLLIVVAERGAQARAYERMPQLDGTRKWVLSKTEDSQDPQAFAAYLNRRSEQDGDLWIIELDVHQGERFIDDLTY